MLTLAELPENKEPEGQIPSTGDWVELRVPAKSFFHLIAMFKKMEEVKIFLPISIKIKRIKGVLCRSILFKVPRENLNDLTAANRKNVEQVLNSRIKFPELDHES
ncbi:MAG: hypothetical protein ABIH35_00505 [Patescibacteria group bacterium]